MRHIYAYNLSCEFLRCVYDILTIFIYISCPAIKLSDIHRLGRTGRAGRAGKGWLVLAPFERSFLRELKAVDCPEDKELKALFDNRPSQDCLDAFLPVLKKIGDGDKVLSLSAERAYQAWLGFYNSNTKRMGKISKQELVSLANEWSRLVGLRYPPALEKRTVGKMGLRGVPGINTK